MKFSIPGNPLPKQRPRSSKGRFYSPSSKEEKRVADHIRAQMDRKKPCGSEVAVTVRFYRGDKRRVDLDNMLKLVLDSANGIIWEDDYLIVQIQARKSYDKEHPRTELEVTSAD